MLTVTVGAKQGEATAFLVEVKQAGLFAMRGLTADDQRRAIGTICPNVLFPYARVAVSQLVTQGGFPNFVLPPVDFDQLFARGLAQQQAAASRAGPGELTRRAHERGSRRARAYAREPHSRQRHRTGTRRRARRRFLGHGARHPVRARRPSDAAVVPQRSRRGADERASGTTAAIYPTRSFPTRIEIHAELAAAVRDAVAIIIAVPSHSLRALLTQLKPLLARDARLAWATKGFELDTGKLPHQVAYDVLGDRYPVAVLSGPTFAREVGMGLPTAMTIASPDADFAAQLAKSLHASNFRAYTSTDIVGVEVGGAVKNVLAVGAGSLRRAGVRRQHAHRADHARPVGGHAARRGARRAGGDFHGARGPRRPGAHQHRQPVAQSAFRPRAGVRQERRRSA